MTLNDKYCDLIDNDNGYDNQLHANRCEKIAEDFAIGFAEWCVKNELFYSIQYGRIETKSLLEIYKKEKGL
jgi:hypothetical protein